MKLICILVSLIFVSASTIAADDTTSKLIKQADYLQNRHEVLAQNVANVSTPKYTTQDLEKPEFLDQKKHAVKIKKVRMVTTNPHHLRGKNKNHKYSTTLDKDSPMKPNKNNVDITKQVTNIAQNTDETSMALKNYRTAMDLINTASGSGGQ